MSEGGVWSTRVRVERSRAAAPHRPGARAHARRVAAQARSRATGTDRLIATHGRGRRQDEDRDDEVPAGGAAGVRWGVVGHV